MADRIGVISKGKLIVIDEKNSIMRKLGKKQLTLNMESNDYNIPQVLKKYNLHRDNEKLVFTYDSNNEDQSIKELIKDINISNIDYKDLQTSESSLEEIFVELVREK